MIGWSLFAFAGVYTWTAVPIVVGSLALAGIVRPAVFAPGFRLLDGALCAVLALAAVQMIPVAPSLRHAASSGLEHAEHALHLNGAEWSAAAHPLTLDVQATAWAATLAGTCILLFWSARTVFGVGGIRRVARAIAIFGLIAAILSILQHATSPRLFYWTWAPVASNASPYTPFGNRNHLASWLVMAIPLTLGYVLMRLESVRARTITADMFDDTGVWLVGSVFAMAAALLASLSRSGIIAGAAGVLAFVVLGRRRLLSKGRAALVVALAAVGLFAAAYTNLNALWSRLNDAVNVSGVGGRREIWAVTLTIIRAFPITGVGVGAFERAMSIYQPPHIFSFNTAHNEYLQLLTEGGVPLLVLVGVAVGAGGVGASRRLTADRSPMFWIRAGALSAVFAVAVQSIWETGLRIPANGVLFAICCAIPLTGPQGRDAG